MTIWKTEYLKYKYFFGAIFIIQILLELLECLNISSIADVVDMVYSFWQMLSWVAMIALTIYDLFAFFYLGKDRMLHLLPVKKSRILYMKFVVFGSYMMAYFVLGLIQYLILLPAAATDSKLTVGFLYLGSKFIAVLSFFALLSVALVIIKCIGNRVLGGLVMAAILGVVIVLHAYALIQIIDLDWMIGIIDGAAGVNQYANIMPVVFVAAENTNRLVENSFYMISVILNVFEIIAGFLISSIVLKIKKFNYIEN